MIFTDGERSWEAPLSEVFPAPSNDDLNPYQRLERDSYKVKDLDKIMLGQIALPIAAYGLT